MRTVPLLLAALLAAPAALAAQEGTPRRPPADTIRFGGAAAAGADSIRMADADSVDSTDDDGSRDPGAAPAPQRAAGPFDAPAGPGPFSVQSSGRVAPRPPRTEVVWAGQRPAARVAARDTAAPPRDSAGAPAPATPPRTAPTAAAPPPAQAPAGRAGVHTVVAGETFYGIARRYGVTAAQLRAVNPGLDPEVLEVGDEVRLPAGARATTGAPAPAPSATPARTSPAAGAARTHTVAAGETLFSLARRYGVTVADIRRANRLESDQLRTGQRLVIPPAS